MRELVLSISLTLFPLFVSLFFSDVPVPPTSSPTSGFCNDFTFDDRRRLQAGECSPNILDSATENLDLSLIVSLFQVAGLDEIFDCPGECRLHGHFFPV